MKDCPHVHWTIKGNERAGNMGHAEVTCLDCDQQVLLRHVLVSMQERLLKLEARETADRR
jgi:hypothetical protein